MFTMLRSVISRGCGVLGGQSERVPAHWPQHAGAVAAVKVRDDVSHRVVEDVPHVQAVRGRVRQHLELVPAPVVERLAGRGIRDVEGPRFLPDALPLRLDLFRLVSVHRSDPWP